MAPPKTLRFHPVIAILIIGLISCDVAMPFSPTLQHVTTSRRTTSNAKMMRKEPTFLSSKHLISSTSQMMTSSSSSSDETKLEEESSPPPDKILVLGGTGFLGSEILHQLSTRSIPFLSTSTSGRDSTIKLDVTSPTLQHDITSIIQKNNVTAVISTIGSINTPNDYKINSASGTIARGAKKCGGGVTKFVFIGNDLRVRQVGKVVPFLKSYMEGKEESERVIQECFGSNNNYNNDDGDDVDYYYCIIRPTFIYGGNKLDLNPPRVTSSIGKIFEELLGNYAVTSVAEKLPGIVSLALDPPVSVEAVATASINAALGLLKKDNVELKSRQDILDAVAVSSSLEREARRMKRRQQGKEKNGVQDDDNENDEEEDEERRYMANVKTKLLAMTAAAGGIGVGYDSRSPLPLQDNDSSSSSSTTPRTDLELMKELESLLPFNTKPAYNPLLNGQWDFVKAGPPTIATSIVEFLEDTSDLFGGPLFSFQETYLEIGEKQSVVRVVVSGKVLNRDVDLVIQTGLKVDDEVVKDGTRMMERFESVHLGGVDIPIPAQWKQSRQLDITFLDDDMMIARSGVMGEPHLLLRRK